MTTYLLRLQELVHIFYCYPPLPPPTHIFNILSANFHFKAVSNFCHSNLEHIIRSFQQYSAHGHQLSKTLQYCNIKVLPPDGSDIRYFDEVENSELIQESHHSKLLCRGTVRSLGAVKRISVRLHYSNDFQRY